MSFLSYAEVAVLLVKAQVSGKMQRRSSDFARPFPSVLFVVVPTAPKTNDF